MLVTWISACFSIVHAVAFQNSRALIIVDNNYSPENLLVLSTSLAPIPLITTQSWRPCKIQHALLWWYNIGKIDARKRSNTAHQPWTNMSTSYQIRTSRTIEAESWELQAIWTLMNLFLNNWMAWTEIKEHLRQKWDLGTCSSTCNFNMHPRFASMDELRSTKNSKDLNVKTRNYSEKWFTGHAVQPYEPF